MEGWGKVKNRVDGGDGKDCGNREERKGDGSIFRFLLHSLLKITFSAHAISTI